MNRSESIIELSKALSKFQGEVKNPKNTATNPFFKSKYAPLEEVLNTTRPILSKYGLSVIQSPSSEGEYVSITTILMHESGEWMEFQPLKLKTDKNTAQGAGSAISYGRRYALSAILGISSEDDDDGNIAEPKKEYKPNVPTTKKPNNVKESNLASEKQLNFVYKLVKDKEYGADNISKYIKDNYKKASSKELTKQEASELIEMLNNIGGNDNV